ncbi:MAG: ABC transporter permease [Terriglobia bacterium]
MTAGAAATTPLVHPKWHGDFWFLLQTLITKDFRVRYRNMSLGVLWSLVNPLVMMGILTVIFTKVFPNPNIKHFPVFVLCGLVPYSFFTVAWTTGTTCIVDNASLLKRLPVPQEVVPVAAVLSNSIHLMIQIAMLLAIVILFGSGINVNWLWLPLIWALNLVFICGLALITSAMHVYIRDTRYLVESANTVLFWLVPIFYPVALIPQRFQHLYLLNPLAALVSELRQILMDGSAPDGSTLLQSALVSFVTLGVGSIMFQKLKASFFERI